MYIAWHVSLWHLDVGSVDENDAGIDHAVIECFVENMLENLAGQCFRKTSAEGIAHRGKVRITSFQNESRLEIPNGFQRFIARLVQSRFDIEEKCCTSLFLMDCYSGLFLYLLHTKVPVQWLKPVNCRILLMGILEISRLFWNNVFCLFAVLAACQSKRQG